MKYYIKRLAKNELGSIGADGKPHRGRFLFVSKDPQMLEFFPPLSETQVNDFCPVGLVPLYLPGSRRFYCNFVYHNDIFQGKTRNEYRLYSSKDLEGGRYLFEPGDCLLMRKIREDDINPGLYVDLITPKDKSLYWFCNAAVEASTIRGNYAVWEGEIAAFEQKAQAKAAGAESQSVSIDGKVIESASNASGDKVASLFTNQAIFRDFLLVGYDGKCAITRTSIEYGDFCNIEAAHLKPKSHQGLYLPSNGVMLTRDLHWAFDKGFFSFKDDLTVEVHPKVQSPYLKSLEGTQLFLPKDAFFRPNLECVQWHHEHIFGLFQKSGVIKGISK